MDFQGLTPASNADILLHSSSAHSHPVCTEGCTAAHTVCTEGCTAAHTQQVRHDTNLSPPSMAKG